jgi:hypothetical protein
MGFFLCFFALRDFISTVHVLPRVEAAFPGGLFKLHHIPFAQHNKVKKATTAQTLGEW